MFLVALIGLPLIAVLWAVMFGRGIVRAKRGVRAIRGLARRDRGLCPACGYDLRASPELCPECGTAAGGKVTG